MELKVSVHEKYNGASFQQSLLHSQHNICAISCENVIVLTRVLYRSNSFKQSIPVYTVYAADLNTPFETHVITESLDQILQLKFSSNGRQLLIVTSSKHLQLYVKGAGLHEWTNTYTSTWCEEDILFVDFFHTKNEACIQITDVKVNAPYSEKFQSLNHQPTLKSIGYCAQNGLFAITSSGLFLACTINSNGVMEEEERAILGPIRDNFNLASAAFSQNGHIHIVAWKSDIVKCWDVELGYIERERIACKDGTIFGGISINGNRKLKIKVLSTSFFSPRSLKTEENEGASFQKTKVLHLKHTDPKDPKSLLLFIQVDKDDAGSKDKSAESLSQNSGIKQEDSDKREQKYVLQLYQLKEKSRTLFQFFSTEKANTATTANEWVCQSEWKTNVPVVAINTPSLNLLAGPTSIPYLITIATSDDTIYVINKDTMQQISKYTLQPSRIDDHAASKRNGKEKKIISITNTWTNLHLIVLDSNGGLHILSLLKQTDMGPTLWLVYIMLLLEYTLVSGNDWCDILMAAHPGSALTMTDRLSETFYQHPLKVVSHLSSRFLMLKNSLLRSSSNFHQRSIETRLQAQLSAILKLFHSLRPVTTDLITVEKNLYATIQGYIESRNSLELTDIDKSIDNLLFSCNILDCQIDPTLSRDLQILLEFSTDLALYLLLLLVQNPKYELAKETKILQHLREILFISRLWFRHNKLVFPQMIRKNDSVDIWAQLYKLLTRLAQVIPGEPDAGFLDDCVILETQVLCREIPLFIPPRGIIGCTSTAPSAHYPLQFYFDQVDPNPPVSSVNPRPLEGSLAFPQPLDPLYYHFLGQNEKLQCTRCFSLRGAWWGANDVTMWEQEWCNRCICSGHWAPTAPQQPPKPA